MHLLAVVPRLYWSSLPQNHHGGTKTTIEAKMKATECRSWLTVLMCCKKEQCFSIAIVCIIVQFKDLSCPQPWDQELGRAWLSEHLSFSSLSLFQFDTIPPCAWQSTQWCSISAQGLIHTFHANVNIFITLYFCWSSKLSTLIFIIIAMALVSLLLVPLAFLFICFLDIFWLLFQ